MNAVQFGKEGIDGFTVWIDWDGMDFFPYPSQHSIDSFNTSTTPSTVFVHFLFLFLHLPTCFTHQKTETGKTKRMKFFLCKNLLSVRNSNKPAFLQ